MREDKERNEAIFKAWFVDHESQWSIAQRYGISQPRVAQIIKEYRESTPAEDRALLIARELEKLDEISREGLKVLRSEPAPEKSGTSEDGILRDERGQVVRDHTGRLAGARVAMEAGRELRRMLGLDAATKQQVETAVRYILEGVPPEEDV